MSPLKTKKFTILHLTAICVIAIAITFFLTASWEKKKIAATTSTTPMCKTDIKRLSGLKYIKPIMFVDDECESDELSGLKQRVSEMINRSKTNQDIISASFYLKDYTNDDWTSLNDDEMYQPGSLFKVPVLIAILKMNEMQPGFLNKVVKFEKSFNIEKDVAFRSKSIQLGKSYTIKELLTYMIKYSDNNATALVETQMRMDVFMKVFEDFGLRVPKENDKQYFISAKEYSFFIRGIYNAAYLNIDDSEYAAELLTECEFDKAMVKGLPAGTPIAHKFGESGNVTEKELHESGIIYLNGNSYLLTIMTKGKDNDKLAKIIAEISQMVYAEMVGHNSSNVM